MRTLVALAATTIFAALLAVHYQFETHRSEAKIYVQKGLFSPEDCAALIDAAEATNKWDAIEESQEYLPTTEILVEELPPGARVSATYAATSRIFPALARHYGVAASTLALRDLYVVRYDASSPGLATHVDASALSFSIALNGGYGGGGLEFALLDETLAEDAGDAVLFPSRLLHRAAPVVSGARYALVGLVDVAGARGVAVPGLDNAAAAVHGLFATCASVHDVAAPPERGGVFDGEDDAEGPAAPVPRPGSRRRASRGDVLASHAANRLALVYGRGLSSTMATDLVAIVARNSAVGVAAYALLRRGRA